MDRHHWVVSDPPHHEVDYEQAARLLGLVVAEARLKINFGAPEPWLAFPDVDEASSAASAMRAAGLGVVTVSAPDLLNVPSPTSALSFSFADDGFVALTEEGEGEGEEEVRLRYDIPAVGAFSRPPTDFATGDRPLRSSRDSSGDPMRQRSTGAIADQLAGHTQRQQSAADLMARRTSLDLYYPSDAGLRRISIAQDSVDFSGLGAAMRPRASDNMDLCVAECERRFTNLRLDKRMVNVRPRRRPMVGAPEKGQESRILFSFGTIGLHNLLVSVSPDFDDITQYELGSRLSYLMLRGDDPAWAVAGPVPIRSRP